MKKLLFVFSIIACTICFIPSKSINALAVTTQDYFYSIQSPIFLSGSDSNYYVYQEDGALIHFNEQFTEKQLDNIQDMHLYNDELYLLQNDKIINANQEEITTTVTNAIGFFIINGEFYSYNNNVIANSTTKLDTFNNIKDVFAYDGYIYVIDNNVLCRVDTDLTQTSILARLSWETDTEFEIKIANNYIYLLEGNTLKLLNLEGTIINNTLLTPTNIFDRSFISGEVFKIADFDVYNSNIIISDYITGSVQQFRLENNELVFEKLLVASFGADANRLYNPSSLCYTSQGVVVADTGNSRIVLKSDNSILFENITAQITTSDNNNKLFISTQNNIISFNMDTQERLELSKPQDMIDIKCNQIGDLYALTNNQILKYDNSIWTTITTLDYTPIALQGDASGQFLFIRHATGIQSLNLNTLELTDCYTSSNIIDFAVDYKNNIYTLENESITKIADNAIIDRLPVNTSYNKFILTLNTGDFYLLNSTLHTLETIKNNNFADNLADFENDLSYLNGSLLTSPALIAQVKNTSQLYKYPFNVSPLVELNVGDKVIVLEPTCEENTNFAYCIINFHTNNNILGYINVNDLDYNIVDKTPSFDKVKIITAIAYVYKYPTTLPYSEITTTNKTLVFNKVVDILSYCYDIRDYTGTSFYCVRLSDGTIGYINSRTAMNSELDVYQKSFQPNGKVEKTLEDDEILCYDLVDGEYIPNGYALSDGQYVFLANEINTELPYTKVVYLNEKDEQISTYVETKFVYQNDLTKHKYFGLILLLVALVMGCIITALVLIIRKKKKLEEKI